MNMQSVSSIPELSKTFSFHPDSGKKNQCCPFYISLCFQRDYVYNMKETKSKSDIENILVVFVTSDISLKTKMILSNWLHQTKANCGKLSIFKAISATLCTKSLQFRPLVNLNRRQYY